MLVSRTCQSQLSVNQNNQNFTYFIPSSVSLYYTWSNVEDSSRSIYYSSFSFQGCIRNSWWCATHRINDGKIQSLFLWWNEVFTWIKFNLSGGELNRAVRLADFLLLLRRCIWRSASCHVSVDVIENIFQVLARLDWIAADISCSVFSSSIVLSLLLCLSTDQHGSSDWYHLEHYGGDHKQRLVGLFRQSANRAESDACCFYPVELNGRRLSAGARHLFCSEQICKSCSSFNYARVLFRNRPWTSFISGFGDKCYWLIE